MRDFNFIVIKNTQEESEKLQKELFSHGFKWCIGHFIDLYDGKPHGDYICIYIANSDGDCFDYGEMYTTTNSELFTVVGYDHEVFL